MSTGTEISSVAGNVQVTGNAASGQAGVNLFNTASMEVTSGSLTVTGTGGGGAGVRLSDVVYRQPDFAR